MKGVPGNSRNPQGKGMKQGVLNRYREFLPVTPATPMITLGEGGTPLVRSHTLEKELGCGELYFKLEGCNPTGSFKDRGMVVAVAKAAESGSSTIIWYPVAANDSVKFETFLTQEVLSI